MYVCMYVLWAYVHMYVCMSVYTSKYACVYMYVQKHACMHVRIYVCIVCICMYVCIYYVCIYRWGFLFRRVFLGGFVQGFLSRLSYTQTRADNGEGCWKKVFFAYFLFGRPIIKKEWSAFYKQPQRQILGRVSVHRCARGH